MKIVKKVNARLTVLLMFIFFLQALLWAGYLPVMALARC